LSLDGDAQFDDLNWLIKGRASSLIRQLQEREVREEMAQRQQEAMVRAEQKRKAAEKKAASSGTSSGSRKMKEENDGQSSLSTVNYNFPRIRNNPQSMYRRKGFHFGLQSSSSTASLPPLEASSIPALDFGKVDGFIHTNGATTKKANGSRSKQTRTGATASSKANAGQVVSNLGDQETKSEKLSPISSGRSTTSMSTVNSSVDGDNGDHDSGRSNLSGSLSPAPSSHDHGKKSRSPDTVTSPTTTSGLSRATPSSLLVKKEQSNNYGVDAASSYHPRPLASSRNSRVPMDQVDAQEPSVPLSPLPSHGPVYSPSGSSYSSSGSLSPPWSPPSPNNNTVDGVMSPGGHPSSSSSSLSSANSSRLATSASLGTLRSPSRVTHKARRMKPEPLPYQSGVDASPTSPSPLSIQPHHNGNGRLQSLGGVSASSVASVASPLSPFGGRQSGYDLFAKQHHELQQRRLASPNCGAPMNSAAHLSPACDTLPAPFPPFQF
jgi:hypothetical protein